MRVILIGLSPYSLTRIRDNKQLRESRVRRALYALSKVELIDLGNS